MSWQAENFNSVMSMLGSTSLRDMPVVLDARAGVGRWKAGQREAERGGDREMERQTAVGSTRAVVDCVPHLTCKDTHVPKTHTCSQVIRFLLQICTKDNAMQAPCECDDRQGKHTHTHTHTLSFSLSLFLSLSLSFESNGLWPPSSLL